MVVSTKIFSMIASFCGTLAVLGCMAQPAVSGQDQPASESSRPIRAERNLEFRRIDGEQLTADVFRPDDDQVYPLVLMIHGGAWSSGDKWQVQDHAREMAQAGFVACAINYRLAPRFQISAQIDDCRYALRWAVEQAEKWQADSEQVCLWGYSAGAHLAAWLATEPKAEEPKITAVVAGGAPCDFEFIPAKSTALSYVMGGTREQVPAAYAAASPTVHASQDTCPFFFFHGSSDLLVPMSSSRTLYDKLLLLDVESEYYVVKDRGHLLTFIDVQARRRAIEFLRAHTQEKK